MWGEKKAAKSAERTVSLEVFFFSPQLRARRSELKRRGLISFVRTFCSPVAAAATYSPSTFWHPPTPRTPGSLFPVMSCNPKPKCWLTLCRRCLCSSELLFPVSARTKRKVGGGAETQTRSRTLGGGCSERTNGREAVLSTSPLKTRQSNRTDVMCVLLTNKVVSQQDYKDLCNMAAEGQRLADVSRHVLWDIVSDAGCRPCNVSLDILRRYWCWLQSDPALLQPDSHTATLLLPLLPLLSVSVSQSLTLSLPPLSIFLFFFYLLCVSVLSFFFFPGVSPVKNDHEIGPSAS